MIRIDDKRKCTGCTACASLCPHDAIRMVADEEGFLYPQINENQCSDCGLCERVCPAQKPAAYHPQQVRRGFLIQHSNSSILFDSTSGGFFTPIAEWTFQQGGAVCAATFDHQFHVIHAFAEAGTDLHPFRGSKYVQSDLGNCFVRIREMLNAGRLVTFVGTTCQVYGLKAFLGKEYDQLYTVDLVCHGVASPKLWDAYLQYQQKKYHSQITDVRFRSKLYGYQSSRMKIDFANGRTSAQDAMADLMLRSFYSDIASRPSCYSCPFRVLERCSDFSIYDAYKAHQLLPDMRCEDQKGHTNVIAHTERAVQLLNQLPNLRVTEVNVEKAIALNGKMVRQSAVPHPKRDEFYQNISPDSIAEHVQEYLPLSAKTWLIRKVRFILNQLGLLGLAKKVKRLVKP